MFCKNCGNEIRDGVQFCPACGQPVNGGQNTDPVRENGHSSAPGTKPPTGGAETDAMAIVSLILGVASIVLAIAGSCAVSMPMIIIGLACGVLAIVMSSMSKKNHGSSGFATAGLVLGIIGLIIAAIVLVAYISCMARVSSFANAIDDIF